MSPTFPEFKVMRTLELISEGIEFTILDDQFFYVVTNHEKEQIEVESVDILYEKEWVISVTPSNIRITGNGLYWLRRWQVATKRKPKR